MCRSTRSAMSYRLFPGARAHRGISLWAEASVCSEIEMHYIAALRWAEITCSPAHSRIRQAQVTELLAREILARSATRWMVRPGRPM